MRLLGMDLASRAGLAILDGETLVHAETFRPRADGTIDPPRFFNEVHGRVAYLVGHFGIQNAALEAPLPPQVMSNANTHLILTGLRAVAMAACGWMGADCVSVNQSTWRKAFLGNGRADKLDARRQCDLLGWNVKTDDEAEACGVAWWLAGHLRRSHSPANQPTLV